MVRWIMTGSLREGLVRMLMLQFVLFDEDSALIPVVPRSLYDQNKSRNLETSTSDITV